MNTNRSRATYQRTRRAQIMKLIEVKDELDKKYYFFTVRGAKAFIDNLYFEKHEKAWFTGRYRSLLSLQADRSVGV